MKIASHNLPDRRKNKSILSRHSDTTLQKNQHAKNRLTDTDIEKLSPSAIENLQRTFGNQYVIGLTKAPKNISKSNSHNAKSIQRIKKYPVVTQPDSRGKEFGTETITDLSAKPETIAADKLDGVEAQKYIDIYRQQQADSKAYPNIVFETGDIETLRHIVEEAESKADAISCLEGQVKVASVGQEINFGDVTTCMTITVTMKDGTRVTAHEGMFQSVGDISDMTATRLPAIVTKIQSKIESLKGSHEVVSVLAKGAGGFWQPNFSIAADPSTAVPITRRKTDFESLVSSQFKAPAKFENHDAGELRI